MIRATLHRYSVYAFVLRSLKVANMMIEAALFNARQTGLDKQQAVQEKLALLACYREGINAHLAAAIAMGRAEPGRPLDAEPIAALYGARAGLLAAEPNDACLPRAVRRPDLRHPDFVAFQDPETAPWLEKYYTINEDWRSEDRRRRLAFARPAQLQLRRSPADLPALRAIAAFCPPHHGLPEISTGTHRSASSTSPLAFRTGCSSASERCGRAQPARGIRVSG